MQFQSDILGVPLYRPAISETTALGAAYLAGLSTGFWHGFDEIRDCWSLGNSYAPQMDQHQSRKLVAHWHKAVECTRNFIV